MFYIEHSSIHTEKNIVQWSIEFNYNTVFHNLISLFHFLECQIILFLNITSCISRDVHWMSLVKSSMT